MSIKYLATVKAIGFRAGMLWGSAGITALAIVLRYILSKGHVTKFISNLAVIGHQVNSAGESDSVDFDVIIVGGGTSGCVLASRLSEDPSIRVLLLEAGGSGRALAMSRIPSGYGKLFRTRHVFGMRTEPQVHANQRTQFWPRAKLLGGCSSINAQMAQYGAPEDFDQWARSIGDQSWSWKEFCRYFRKFEKYIPDSKYPLVDASARGSKGPVRVGYFNTVTRASKAFITACMKIGIPFTPDFNGPAGTMGVSRVMTYVDQRTERVSSESAYLTEDVLARPNLKVAIYAQLTQILFEKVGGEIRAIGVEFANSESGPRYRARARKDIIISAGAVHSPHILMLSGVGPAEHLKEHGIPVVHDLPGVGDHLVDHPVVDVYFKDKLGQSVKFLRPATAIESIRLLTATARYMLFGGGPLATNLGESAAFVRTDDPVLFPPDQYPTKLKDITGGPGAPDLELYITPLAYKEHGAIFFPMTTLALHAYVLRPSSSGAVRLRSASPWVNPSVNPNYCQSQDDVDRLVRGVKLCLKIAQTEPLASFLDHDDKGPELDQQLHLKTDAELAEVVRQRVETVYHPVSTCRMMPLEEGGVVDSKLRVYGISNLRVCDASIFPWIVSGHTAGACFAIGEKLSDIIKGELNA